MNKKLVDYAQRKDRQTWFYQHLKKDVDFKKEAVELKNKLTIQLPAGPYIPTSMTDFDLTKDSGKDHKIELIDKFMERWNVHSGDALLGHLLNDDENDLPQMYKFGIFIKVDKEEGIFKADIPISARREDLDYLWSVMNMKKKDLGINTASKPKNEFTERRTRLAYRIWKLKRDDKTWPEVVRELNNSDDVHEIFDITMAKRQLKTYGPK